MKMATVYATLLGTGVLAGCAAPTIQPGPDTTSRFGRIIDRSQVAAQPKWSVNESYTRSLGPIGVALAHAHGEAAYFRYVVEEKGGTTQIVRARNELAVGVCAEIVIPKQFAQQPGWMLDQVGIRESNAC